MSHNPAEAMCPESEYGDPYLCQCDLIGRVRANERADVLREMHLNAHVWRKAPGRKECVCAADADHDGSPVDVWREREAKIRADERRHAEMAREIDRVVLLERWRDDGHAVMFNHANDDLTPAQRVGKWLEAQG